MAANRSKHSVPGVNRKRFKGAIRQMKTCIGLRHQPTLYMNGRASLEGHMQPPSDAPYCSELGAVLNEKRVS